MCQSECFIRVEMIELKFVLVSTDGQFIFTIGTQESAIWNSGTATKSNPTISYTYQDKHALVELLCAADDANQFDALGEIATNEFRFQLTHKKACWKKFEGNSIRSQLTHVVCRTRSIIASRDKSLIRLKVS